MNSKCRIKYYKLGRRLYSKYVLKQCLNPHVNDYNLKYRGTLCANEYRTHKANFPSSRIEPGPEVIKLFSCSTQLSMKFSLLINMKMPTIVGIIIFISRESFILSYI